MKDELSETFDEYADSMAREAISDPELTEPSRRSTRIQVKIETEQAKQDAKSLFDIVADEVVQVAQRLYQGQLGVEDDDETIECLVDSARDNLETMKTTMIRFIKVVPASNTDDHLWKERGVSMLTEVSQSHSFYRTK